MIWSRRKKHPPILHRPLISLLVPFESDDPERLEVWEWLKRYWEDQLDGNIEIVMGRDRRRGRGRHNKHRRPFSKTAAVNDAFRRSCGDIIVILDADAYLPGSVILHCAERIRYAREVGVHLWFVPYRYLYRLTRHATHEILESSPCHPLQIPDPPPADDVEGRDGSGWGHYFGALIQIMPREAFEAVGGMDERFCGWGGEDVAFLLALDCLWGKHKNTTNDVFHLWHPQLHAGEWVDSKGRSWKVRLWEGQTAPRANDVLAQRYSNARGDATKMAALLAEGRTKFPWNR